ncbi:MAG: glycosyltransferase [Candidatus Helarchaeota archaeon]
MNTSNKGTILIGMPLQNSANTLRRAIKSVLSQKNLKRNLILFIVDDNSTDNWKEVISDYIYDLRIVFKSVNIGKVYAVRNYILDYVRENMPKVEYIGRLDADDMLADEYVLCRIEKIMDKYAPDVIIAGNKQMLNDKIIRVNYATKNLLDYNYLEKRLALMAKGVLEGELPSCNTFVRPIGSIYYKNLESAEDHWYTVDLLLNQDKYKIYVAEDIIYAIYTLNGLITSQNKKTQKYLESRKKLYKYFLYQIRMRG